MGRISPSEAADRDAAAIVEQGGDDAAVDDAGVGIADSFSS